MNLQITRPGAIILLLSSSILVVLGIVASTGFFVIDEFIYFMAAYAFHNTGGLFVDNGFEHFGSQDLRIWFLREGPSGLTPQYPPGTAVLGGLLYPLFGEKALIAINVGAGIGTLVATYLLARRLFGAKGVPELTVIILAFATFWAEYAVGHWPHSVAVFSTTLGLYFFAIALDRDEASWKPALASGMAVGAGLLFRVDGVLVLPGIAAVTILFASRPVQTLLGGAAGLLPFASLLALANWLKFGTWNPLSYGEVGGGANLWNHWPTAMILLVGMILLLALRRFSIPRLGPYASLIVVMSVVVALLLLASFSGTIARLVAGVQALILDLTSVVDNTGRVVRQPDGTQLFNGLPKKALAQSLPWLGALALLVGMPWGERSRSVLLVLFCAAGWALPFLMLSWHGGTGSNMRYLLPVVPLLSALVAWILIRLVEGRPKDLRMVAIGALAGYLASILHFVVFPDRIGQIHQIFSTYALYGIAAVCLLAGVRPGILTLRSALMAAGIGLGLAHFYGAGDLLSSQARRSGLADHSARAASIPEKTIFYGAAEGFGYTIERPDHLVALPATGRGNIDADLLRDACREGFRIIIADAYIPVVEGFGFSAQRLEEPALPSFSEMNCG